MVVGAAGVSDALKSVASAAGMASATSGAAGGPPFGGMLRSMVDQTATLDQKASDAITGLLNGSGVEVHDAMIAGQKADMAFQLALQVRNKAVAAYQQMMTMQF
ncbi:flagellar hook-basal body complex protein FliE [Granulicella sibirica]|uniref:Flagellar hook-basal body complex protein FliE n=1 Tax=Granulicella sibirica TaxID=2479048 RepID=A0A4Q0T3Q6_9BACT|nr:flagellar hook-basal body complex protein FliE [Granulicella sibirica]RXH56619.1 flagellar hook-basal body complex subunit FliE [Granulicella sibirica]